MAVPITAPTKHSWYRWASPSANKTDKPATAKALATSAQNSSARRGKRSETAPPTSRRATCGAEVARPT